MLLLLAIVAALLVWYLYHSNYTSSQYWKKRGVPWVPALSIFNKNAFLSFLDTPQSLETIYRKAEGLDFIGYFHFRTPALMVRNPEIIQCILSGDFYSFSSTRHRKCARETDPLSQHLLALNGAPWKELRVKISPFFSSGKLKNMFSLLNEKVDQFLLLLDKNEGVVIDANEFCGHLSVSAMMSCAFGLNTELLDPGNEKFLQIGKSAFEAGFWTLFKAQLKVLYPSVFYLLGLGGYVKGNETFCINFIRDVIHHRQKNGINRPDFVQLLMGIQSRMDGIKNREERKYGFIAAQVFSFLVAGYETTANALCSALYELGQHPEVVEKLRKEVDKSRGNINYETLSEMQYLDQVIKEVLRKHSPVLFVPRVCIKTTVLPKTSIVIEEGTQIIIPVLALHHDEQYFPRPDVFYPERFDQVTKIGLPHAPYLPFSDGPRKCIGMRFAILEMKLALAKIVSSFDIHLDDSAKQPIELEKYARTYKIRNKVNVIIKKRSTEV